MLLQAALDITLTLLSLLLASEIRLVLPFGRDLNEPIVWVNWFIYLLTGVVWLAVFSQFGIYTRRWANLRAEWGVLTLAVLTALLILAGGLYLTFRQVSRLQFVYFGAIDLILLTAMRVISDIWRSRNGNRGAWRILIAGSGQAGRSLAAQLAALRPAGVQLVGFLDGDAATPDVTVEGLRVLGSLNRAAEIIQRERVSEIVLALPHEAYDRMLSVIMELEQLPVQVSLVPDVLDLAWFLTRVDDLNGVPLLRLRESPLNGPARAMKRVMDIVIAGVALLVALPIMAIVAIAVKRDSPGPAIIRQKRIGENAQPFDMIKIRTMVVGAGERGEEEKAAYEKEKERNLPSPISNLSHKRPDDPRVTRVGRVLRRYSIDELPQLLNVLRGEMSLVGPRPELPWLVDCYEPWQRHRFAVPPGMTGWWQVHGRSDRPMHQNVEDDLYYIRNYSLWLDIEILLRTVPVVITGRGAY